MADYKLRLATSIPDVDPEYFDQHKITELLFNIAAEDAGKGKDFGQVGGALGGWRIEILGDDGFTARERRAIKRGFYVPTHF